MTIEQANRRIDDLNRHIDDAIRLMACDPDGKISPRMRFKLLKSYALAFDPDGIREEVERLRAKCNRLIRAVHEGVVPGAELMGVEGSDRVERVTSQ